VVSERLGAYSCGEIYSRLWIDDLPVFITTDSILHAWHRSYDMMLAEIEQTMLWRNFENILDGMAGQLKSAEGKITEPLRESLLDADYFVTVARSLIRGSPVASSFNQDARVTKTLASITAEQLDSCFDLFGQPRAVDFSQFKLRGHYEAIRGFQGPLQFYFKCMMWLSRIDFRIAGGPFQDSECADRHMAPPRELGTSIVLHWLLRESGGLERWLQSEKIIQNFVGWTDSLTFPQLGEILSQAGIKDLSDVKDLATLESLQASLVSGRYGLQNISSDYFVSPLGPMPVAVPSHSPCSDKSSFWIAGR
jgi:hypothetical protein